jgi:hypothetical protein
MRVGIELNGVLRDTIGKIIQTYEKVYLEETPSEEEQKQYTVLSEDESVELPKENSFNYGITYPITSLNLMEFFKFRDENEYYSFMYEEFPMNIFGHAGSVEYSSFNDLNDIYRNIRDNHDLLIVSDEIGKSKPASLFFLSKFGCLIEKVKFYSNSTINSMWDEIDVLVTANPDLITNHPIDKVIIKFEQEYNKHVDARYMITKIKELESTLEKLEI